MAQNIFDFWQFNNMSTPLKQTTNVLNTQNDTMQQKQNTSVPTLNFGAWISKPWVLNINDSTNFLSNLQNTQNEIKNRQLQQPTQAKPNISLIPQANADSENTNNDYLNELDYDIKNWATVDEIKNAYPELKWNTEMIQQLHYDISNWASLDEVKNAYPELWQTTSQPQWFINKLWQWLKESFITPIQTLWEQIVKKPVDRFLDYVQWRETDTSNTYNASDIWKTTWAVTQAGMNIVAPWLTAWLTTLWSTDTWNKVLSSVPWQIWVWATLWGVVWGKKWAIIWGALWTIPWVTDYLLNNVPWLKEHYNNLTDEWKAWIQTTISNAVMLWAWAWLSKKVWKTPTQVAWELNKMPITVANWIVDAIKTMPQNIKQSVQWVQEWITATSEYWTKLLTWLNRETQQAIKNNPTLFAKVKSWEITAEWIAWDLKTNIWKRLENLSETWKWYEELKKSDILFPKEEIQWLYDNRLLNEWLSKNLVELPIEDRNAIKQAQFYLNELPNEQLTTKEAIELKWKLRSLVSYDKWVSPQWERVVKWIIKDLDNNIKEKIPRFKELDAVYWPEREFLNKVQKDILNKDWTLKDNAISTIRNLTWKWKENKLDRLEQVMPWISEKVKSIKAYEDLQNAIEWKTWSYARGALLWWGGLIMWWPIWWITTFVLTHPSVASKALELYWLSKQKVTSLINKIKTKSILTPQEKTDVLNWITTPSNKVFNEIMNTPQTVEKWVIQESKKELKNILSSKKKTK